VEQRARPVADDRPPRQPCRPNRRPLAYLPLADSVPPIALGLLTHRAMRETRAAAAFAPFCREHIATDHLPGMADLNRG